MSVLLQTLIFASYALATLALALLVVCGLALTWLYKKKGWPKESEAINCWAFAVPKWLRSGTTSNYLIVRRSKYNLVPHVKFAPGPLDQYAEELTPNPSVPKRGLRGFIASFCFKGKVLKGKTQ